MSSIISFAFFSTIVLSSAAPTASARQLDDDENTMQLSDSAHLRAAEHHLERASPPPMSSEHDCAACALSCATEANEAEAAEIDEDEAADDFADEVDDAEDAADDEEETADAGAEASADVTSRRERRTERREARRERRHERRVRRQAHRCARDNKRRAERGDDAVPCPAGPSTADEPPANGPWTVPQDKGRSFPPRIPVRPEDATCTRTMHRCGGDHPTTCCHARDTCQLIGDGAAAISMCAPADDGTAGYGYGYGN